MANLLDEHGNPIKREELKQEQAAPSMTGVRNILSNTVSGGLNPLKLGRIIRSADEGDPENYLAMAEELEEKDPHYAAVLGTRKRAVSQLELTVEAASDSKEDEANAEIVRQWLKTDDLEAILFDILDAIGKGYSITEIIWDTSELQWLPKELKWRDPRHFTFADDGRTLRLREGGGSVDLMPYKYIVHRHPAKTGLTVRGGVVRQCAWMWLFKNFSIKDWVIYAEAYGQPIRVGKYGPNASKEDRDVLLRAVSQIGSDAAAIIPESMQIQFVEAQGKSGSADIFKTLIDFADQQMSKAVLGQTTTTDAISGGHAVSQEHNKVREDIERSDAKLLQATLNKQLVVPIVALNKGQQKNYPRIRIGRMENVDVEALTNSADKAVRMGLQISHRGLRDKLGLPEPENEDDVIKLPSFSPADTAPETASIKQNNDAVHTAAAKQSAPDPVEQLSDDLSENWEEVLTPVVDMIEEAAADATNFDEFKEKLLSVLGDIKTDTAAEKIAQANFFTRLAGNHEVDIK